MTKTPEEMAEEYVQRAIQPHMPDEDGECCVRNYDVWSLLPNGDRVQMIFTGPPIKDAFLAGYKAAQQWISVKDRLPPPQTEVLWWNKAAQQAGVSSWEYMSYCDDTMIEWGDAGNVSIRKFTHWQPLPAAPKEEK